MHKKTGIQTYSTHRTVSFQQISYSKVFDLRFINQKRWQKSLDYLVILNYSSNEKI